MTGRWLWLTGFLIVALIAVISLWAHRSSSTPPGEQHADEWPGLIRSRGDSATPTTQTADTSPPDAGAASKLESSVPPVGTPEAVSDDFEGGAAVWHTGDSVGSWHVDYDGFGHVGLSGDGRLRLAPQAADNPGSTHAALVTSTQSFTGDIDIVIRTETAQQLRTGSPPNTWEVGWLVWNYTHDHRFYYALLKPNGWELGKVDNSKLDPSGPECLWPEYENCKYDGAQRYLAVSPSPTFAVGEGHDLRISQSGNEIVLWGNSEELVRYVDHDDPYHSGRAGLYTEDAEVFFDSISVTGFPD